MVVNKSPEGICIARIPPMPPPTIASEIKRQAEINSMGTTWVDPVHRGPPSPPPLVYVIGSLRNPEIPKVSEVLRGHGLEVFDDWFAASPTADDAWKEYHEARGQGYMEALDGWAADSVYRFDKKHLDRSDAAVLVLPAGRSGHLELGYMIGQGMPSYILLDVSEDTLANVGEDTRWDVMYMFSGATADGAHGVRTDVDELAKEILHELS